MTQDTFEQDFVPWSTSHIEANIKAWKKLTPKQVEHYREIYVPYFEEDCSKEQLEFFVSVGVPYFSAWAAKVLFDY